jgi:D-tyrosyl-tRNA(Tyr) deacylase
MRIVAQRVSRAAVRVDEETVGSIGPGLLVLVAFSAADGDAELEWMARKLTGIRVFPDGEGKMNRSVREAGGSLLVVSRGMRPSFTGAAAPERAQGLYELFLDVLRAEGVPVESGRFAAMMDVELVNEGPVTLILDR